METINDYKLLKKHYSEKFAQLCRDLFPTILEKPGKLYELISKHFAPNKFLYDDITELEFYTIAFKEYIYRLYNNEVSVVEKTTKTPKELLDEAGYILYECKTETDIQKFRHYYKRNSGETPIYKEGTNPEIRNGEELCTFNGGRLDECHVFFAVKKNVDEIKRENFDNPRRQDEYGTSVISIQFTRGKVNYLSIKNRYNHTVKNPDATFSNDLDNIIAGLTDAFMSEYNLNIASSNKVELDLPNYVRADDGKHYKSNYEINNVYYCVDNVVIKNFEPKQYDKEKYIVMETMILDLQHKTFVGNIEHFKNIKIEKLEQRVNKEKSTREIIINDTIIITLDNQNRIISYINPLVEEIEDNFLYDNEVLNHIELPNVKAIGSYSLFKNLALKRISLPKVEIIGNHFLGGNEDIECIDLPNITNIGSSVFYCNLALKSISLPKVEKIGDYFLRCNNAIEQVDLPNLKEIDGFFLNDNNTLTSIYLPNVEEIGSYFLSHNAVLEQIDLPNVKKIFDGFLDKNNSLTSINLPSVEYIGDNFLENDEVLERVELPNVINIACAFLYNNTTLTSISLPKLKNIAGYFLTKNLLLEQIDLPKLEETGPEFLTDNKALKRISLPNVKIIEDNFLRNNQCLQSISLPNVLEIDNGFLRSNLLLREIDLPEVRKIGSFFLNDNKTLYSINIPNVTKIGDYFLFFNRCLKKLLLPEVEKIGKFFLNDNSTLYTIDISKAKEIGHDFLPSNVNLRNLYMPKDVRINGDFLTTLYYDKHESYVLLRRRSIAR